MIINHQDYKDKLLGCWMGKNIGSALGKPFEWKRKINDVTFYTQDIESLPFSSEDIDIQLLWLRALEDNGVHIGTPVLSEYFLSYLTANSGALGPPKANMRVGLMPPLSSMTSTYKDSNGAAARTEIWACIAPGCPEIAATKAYHDAIIDHAAGEGLYAAMFIAVVQSAAFIEEDPFELIEIGLSYIPEGCGVARAIKSVQDAYQNDQSWLDARDKVLQYFRGHYATWEGAGISQRDWDYGLHDGNKGYDAPSNIGMIIIGWLYGEGDFARSICTTVNCGEDTNSNAATLGAILGIIDGHDLIPPKWSEPISHKLNTRMIDTYDVKHIPRNLNELVTRVDRLAKIIMLTFRPDVEFHQTKATNIGLEEFDKLINPEMGAKITRNLYGPIFENGIITCTIDYLSDGYIRAGGTAKISLRVGCKLKHDLLLHVKWYLPSGFTIAPVANGMLHCPGVGKETNPYVFEITAEAGVALTNRFVIEFTSPGRHTVALVPIVLLDGGLIGA